MIYISTENCIQIFTLHTMSANFIVGNFIVGHFNAAATVLNNGHRKQFQQNASMCTGLLLGCFEQSELLKEREIYPILGKH